MLWWILAAFGIGDQSACNHMVAHHTWSSDLKEKTPSEIGIEEDCGGLGLQGRPKTHGNMLCESPNWVKYDWPGKPEHSGLGCISFPEEKKQCVFQLAEWKISMAECCEKQRVNSAQQESSR